MSFFFNRKAINLKDDEANRQEFNEFADTIHAIYEQAEAKPSVALDEVKALLARIKGAQTLDKPQRAILEAFAHDTAGFIYLELNRPKEALTEMEKALRTYRVLQDKTPLVNNYLNQSRAWMMRKDVPRTFHSLERGLAAAKEHNLPRAEADVLYKLGVLYSLTEQVDKAQETFRRGLLLVQQLGDRVASATFLAQLGQLNLQLNELEKAEDYLLSSLAVFEEHDDASNIFITCDQLDQLYRRKDDYPKAREFAEKGLAEARRRENSQQENNFLHNLAMLDYVQDDYDSALRYGTESLELSERTNDQESKLRIYTLLAQVALSKNDYEQARRYTEAGYALAKTLEQKREQAVFLNDFAEIKLMEGDVQAARGYMEQVEVIFKALDDLPSQSALYVRLGEFYLDKLNDPQGTARQAEKAFDLCRSQPSESGMFAFTSALRLWQLLAERGYYNEGLESAGRCLNVANGELQACTKEKGRMTEKLIARQTFWLLFVQVLMVLLGTMQDLKTNQRDYRPKTDEVLSQLKERFGDAFMLDTWADEMYEKIT